MFKLVMTDINSEHEGDFVFDIPCGLEHWLLLQTNTPGLFVLNGVEQEVAVDHMILIPPDTPIYYRAIEDRYSDNWLFFTADKNDISVATVPIETPVYDPLAEEINSLFKFLCIENACKSMYRDINIDYAIRMLLNKMVEFQEKPEIPAKYHDLIVLRQKIYADPGLFSSVTEMAEYMHISNGRLQTIYKEAFGVSCVSDIIAARIKYAKYKLICSDMTLVELASECGYKNIEHFFRQFKKHTGFSPKEYQNHVQNISEEEAKEQLTNKE